MRFSKLSFNKFKKKNIDIVNYIVSSIFQNFAHIFLKEEIYAFHLRLNREKAIYYNKNLSKNISPILFQAFIIAENRRFYFHRGIDFIAILRVILYYLQGRKIQGGSTTEQQLTRVITNRYERTIRRKIHEILLAVCIREVLSKEEILGIYLSIAYFGYKMKGIKAACNEMEYNLEALTLVESVNLVARIRYPEPSIKQEKSVRVEKLKKIKKESKRIDSLLQKEKLAMKEEIKKEKHNFLFPGSEINRKLVDRYPPASNFLIAGKKLDEKGKEALVRGFMSEGIPAAFQRDPLYYENIRELVACSLKIHPKYITLIGSARLGYSTAPQKYGHLMNEKSDLDIAVISKSLFKNMTKVFYKWEKDFRILKVFSNNQEKKHWKENLYMLPKNIERGFLDVNKIPNKYTLPAKITELCSFVKNDIKKFDEVPTIAKVSIRIYKNWNAFFVQNVLNLNYTIEKVGEKKKKREKN